MRPLSSAGGGPGTRQKNHHGGLPMPTDVALLTRLQSHWSEPPPLPPAEPGRTEAEADSRPAFPADRLAALWAAPTAIDGIPPTAELGEGLTDLPNADAPILAKVFPPAPPPWCCYPEHRRGWRSIYGPHVVCATCHPPAANSLVAEWLDG